MKQKTTHPVSIRIKYTRYVIPILLITFLSIGAIDTIFYFHSVKESSENEKTAYASTALTSLESYFTQFTSDSSIFCYKNTTQNNLINITQDDGQEFQKLLLNDAPYYPSLSVNYSDNVFFITDSGKLISTASNSSQPVSGFSPSYISEILITTDYLISLRSVMLQTNYTCVELFINGLEKLRLQEKNVLAHWLWSPRLLFLIKSFP